MQFYRDWVVRSPMINGQNVTIEMSVNQFFDDLRLSPRTKKTYRAALRKFLDYISDTYQLDTGASDVTDLSEEHVTSFVASIMPDDIRSPEEVSRMRTAQTTLAAIRKFYSYLASYDLHPNLSTEKLRARVQAMMPRFTPPPPDVKTSDLDRIVDYVFKLSHETDPSKELRRLKIQAMILFLYRTGVRVSELCGLRRRDIDLTDGNASVYRAKGGKSRTVHFDAATAEALVKYWSARQDTGRTAGAFPAFSGRDKVGQPGRAISPRTVEQIVADLGAAAGVENPITPHSFRHGLATELVRRRVRESTVQTILGHASPATTRIYVHKTAMEVADEYQEAFGEYRRPLGGG
jgi:integrase/recombinase XerC